MNEIGQIIAELLVQISAEVATDAVWRRLTNPTRLLIKILATGLVSISLGWCSAGLFPRAFITNEVLQWAYLFIVPVIMGGVMHWIGSRFEKREKRRSTLEMFGFGWLFAFLFSLTRYLATS